MTDGRKFALLIGNSRFNDARLSRLLAPSEDVAALKAVLSNPVIGGFDHVDHIVDGSMEVVRSKILELFDDKRPDDLVFLYYSGHGLLDRRNRLYFALPNSNVDSPASASLEASYVRERMDDSRSRRQILVLDCCHSGAFSPGKKSAGVTAISDQTFDPQGHGRYILTASDALNFAYDGNRLAESAGQIQGNSPFTKYLVEGMETGAAAPDMEFITVDQLYDFVHRQVPPEMSPQRFVDQGAGPMIIARNPLPPDPEIEDDLKAALADDSVFTRRGAVRQLQMLLVGQDSGMANTARKALKERQNVEKHVDVLREIEEALASGPGDRPAVPLLETTPKEPVLSAAKLPDMEILTRLLWAALLIPLMSFHTPRFNGFAFYSFYALPVIGAYLGLRYGSSAIATFAIGGALLPIGLMTQFGGFPARLDIYLISLLAAIALSESRGVSAVFKKSSRLSDTMTLSVIILVAMLLLPLNIQAFNLTLDNGMRVSFVVRFELAIYFLLWVLGAKGAERGPVLSLMIGFGTIAILWRFTTGGAPGGAGLPVSYTFNTLGDIVLGALSFWAGQTSRGVLDRNSEISELARPIKLVICLTVALYALSQFNVILRNMVGPSAYPLSVFGLTGYLIIASFLIGLLYERKGRILAPAICALALFLQLAIPASVGMGLRVSVNLGMLLIAWVYAVAGAAVRQSARSGTH